jgi:anhydro-N-acetylmuramic acid kinase
MQLADPNVIAERTGITTVGDFRRRDIAAGGQAAPLLPGFHAVIFAQPQRTRVVLNLGGIANITILPGAADGAVLGFDTGPANCLLDAWAQRHRGTARDEGGAWAREGKPDATLLARMLAEPYFAQKGPKSSGREVFNVDWLDRRLEGTALAPVDVQATLLELTAQSIANAIRRDAPDVAEVLACGGGVHNGALLDALSRALAPVPVASTARYGVDPDFVEATAFAWLAHRRLRNEPGNLPSVTGSRGGRVLGAVYFGA